MTKKPSFNQNFSSEKIPRIGKSVGYPVPRVAIYPETYDKENMVWKVGMIDYDFECGWLHIGPDTLRNEVISKLKSFEMMTWDAVKKSGSHEVEIVKLAKPAQDRLKELKQVDLEEIFSLRLTGRKRIWGIRDKTALKILWWDPDHRICPSLKD